MTMTMTMTATATKHRRGAAHPQVRYSEEQVMQAKRMLAEAPTVETLAPGVMAEITRATGLPRTALRAIRDGRRWAHVEPTLETTH